MKSSRLLSIFWLTIGVAAVLLQPFVVSAQEVPFDYGFIVSDAELTTYQTMDKEQIQRFLEQKGGYLANYFFQIDAWYQEQYPRLSYPVGTRISAAEHIYNAAQKNRVNPKFLLVMLQKEQSLIEEVTPKQTQLDWAMGYGCLDGQPCNERWRGFHKQVNSTAEQFRYYYDNIHEYNFQPGKSVLVDGQSVMLRNIVTAALYNYTPHLHGNKLFRTIWERYFVRLLPDGTLVQVPGDAGVWLVKDGVRRAFTSELALVSRYSPELIVPIALIDLEQYPRGANIEFAAYSLLRNPATGAIYLLTTENKRLITSMEVFKNLGFNPEEVEDVEEEQLLAIPDGKAITMGDAFPTGAVLKNSKTNELFFVEAGRKYPIIHLSLAKINFPNRGVSTVAPDQLQKYSSGLPIKLKDGVLVKGSGSSVYVISNGLKRHIGSEQAFNSIGYKWTNIFVVDDVVLTLHPDGEPISAS